MPALFQRRLMPVPTLWGLLVLTTLAALGGILLVRTLYPFLALTDPAVPSTSTRAPERVLVVEGWNGEDELRQALAVWRAGGYGRLVTTGGPILDWNDGHPERTYAQRAADFLNRQAPGEVQAIAVSAPPSSVDRTYVSALALRHWWRRQGGTIAALDVFTTGPHARRSRQAWRLALPELAVGVHAARPTLYEPERWWRHSEGVKRTLGEAASLLWSTCCFWPPVPPADAALPKLL